MDQYEALAAAALKGTVPVLTFKKIRSCRGMGGEAWSADLYVDGVAAARIQNEGSGGSTSFDWSLTPGGTPRTSPLRTRLEEYCSRIPPWDCRGQELTTDIELLVGEALEETLEAKALVKKCAAGVPFQTPAMRKQGEWGFYTGPYTVAVREEILQREGPCRFAHEVFLHHQPLDLPKEADRYLPTVLKGQAVLLHGGKWMAFKVKDSAAARATLSAKYPGALYLNDLYREAVARRDRKG